MADILDQLWPDYLSVEVKHSCRININYIKHLDICSETNVKYTQDKKDEVEEQCIKSSDKLRRSNCFVYIIWGNIQLVKLLT